MAKTECAVCKIEIEVLEVFNCEPMCEECIQDPENKVIFDG